MKLIKVHITTFQSIQDSTEFEIGDITCLVGKNESGKTALLKALYCLNPIIGSDGKFDVTNHYPRQSLSDYENAIEDGDQEHAHVVKGTFSLEASDIAAIQEKFGIQCFKCENPTLVLRKGYSNELELSKLDIDSETVLKHLVQVADLSPSLTTELLDLKTSEDMLQVLNGTEQTEAIQGFIPTLEEIAEYGVAFYIYEDVLYSRVPKFLYFDEYYQMKGQDNLDALKDRVDSNCLNESDHPLLGLIELAGLRLDKLVSLEQTESLLSKLETAGIRLTNKVLTYWSQNLHLRMKFDVRQSLPGDPEGMTHGTNIWGRIEDTKHMVSTALGTRSRGFVWFFSFLAWYSQIRRKEENLILLLDEPGLSLHGKAQADLLRYFEEELKPHNQLIYTTHSPFMVNPMYFDHVRIVQNLSIEPELEDQEQQGTQVTTEILKATKDSLFPLQNALGYEIFQTLFIGPNCLVVEGVTDLMYLQHLSNLLQAKGREGLDSGWTITPAGGSSNIPTFVALIGAQTHLNVAVLIDYQKKDRQRIENLYKSKLLNENNVVTFDKFTANNEADIEDMFQSEFYLKLVNGAYGISIALEDLPVKPPRITQRVDRYLKKKPLPNSTFNHYRPARYFNDNIDVLANELNDEDLGRFENAFKYLNSLL